MATLLPRSIPIIPPVRLRITASVRNWGLDILSRSANGAAYAYLLCPLSYRYKHYIHYSDPADNQRDGGNAPKKEHHGLCEVDSRKVNISVRFLMVKSSSCFGIMRCLCLRSLDVSSTASFTSVGADAFTSIPVIWVIPKSFFLRCCYRHNYNIILILPHAALPLL